MGQGSDPLVAASVPAHHDPSRVVCFDDRPQDQGVFSGSPLVNLNLRRRLHYRDSQSDKLVVSEAAEVQILRDPNDLANRDHFTTPSTVTGTSPVVRSDDGKDTVYLVATFAEVERWDLHTSPPTLAWSVDSQRTGCAADRLTAPPMVQLRRFSSAAFQVRVTTDLVYVATRFSSLCSGHADEDNQIIAYNGATGGIEWTFNAKVMGVAPYDMDIIYSGMTQAPGSDILFVGTDRKSPTQDSLWAIDVLTGTLVWSTNVGPVWTKPLLMDDRLYVSTTAGAIKAINPSTGATLWTTSNGGTPITNDPRIIKTAAGEVLIASVDTLGKVWVVRDDNFFGSEVWSINPPDDAIGGSRPLVAGLGGENLFFGGVDGRIYQIDLATGAIEASRLTVAGEAVLELAIQQDDTTARAPSLFATTDGGRLLRFCQPFRSNTYPLDTDGDGVTDGVDNAPTIPNPGQADSDQDGIGDVSDPPSAERALAAYWSWIGDDSEDPDTQFGADPNGDYIPNGLAFFLGDSGLESLPTASFVMEDTTQYFEVVSRRSDIAFDVGYGLNYSPNLVDWNVAQDGTDGVVITVLDDGGAGDKVTIRIPASGSRRIFSKLTVSDGAP
jgi:outer membrane protein assembly factor BamB